MTVCLKPAWFYTGKVMHIRLKPFVHRFNYRVLNLLIDLDRLDEAGKLSIFFAINKFSPISFFEKDFGDGKQKGLAASIRQALKRKDETLHADKILLLCYPRIFGYVFNPIALYYCFENNVLKAMVYEVRNTFGQKHIYVLPIEDGQIRESGLRQMCDKKFHVSPFIGMDMRYFFRMTLPEEKLCFRILEKDKKGALLTAALHAKSSSITSVNIIKHLTLKPFVTLKVIIGIHYEALRLWSKGAKFYKNPHKENPSIKTDQ